MIRADQLLPVSAGDHDALCTAVVRHIAFHGHHVQVALDAAGVPVSLNMNSDYNSLKIGDIVGLKMLVKGVFYA